MVATGYVAAADPTATTYVLDCERGNCAYTNTRSEYARITAGPGWQEYNRFTHDDDGGATADESVRSSCTFTGTTEAFCEDYSSKGHGSIGYELSWWKVTYLPVLPESRGQRNFETYPGLQPMLITSGVELLAGTGAATATTATTTDSQIDTAIATGTETGTGTASAASTSDTATSDAASFPRHTSLLFSLICFAVITITL